MPRRAESVHFERNHYRCCYRYCIRVRTLTFSRCFPSERTVSCARHADESHVWNDLDLFVFKILFLLFRFVNRLSSVAQCASRLRPFFFQRRHAIRFSTAVYRCGLHMVRIRCCPPGAVCPRESTNEPRENTSSSPHYRMSVEPTAMRSNRCHLPKSNRFSRVLLRPGSPTARPTLKRVWRNKQKK